MMRKTRFVGLLLLVSLVVMLGCNVPPKKRYFINQMGRANKQLGATARAFYKAIQPIGVGQPVDASKAQSALASCESALNEANRTFENMKPPNNSASGPALLTKYKAFLSTQNSIMESCLKPIVQIIRDNDKFPTPNEKWAKIYPLLKKAEELEKTAYKEVNEAQQEYAKEHNFKLSQ